MQSQPTTEPSSSSSPPLSPGSAAEEAVQSGVGIQVPLEDRVKGPWSPEEDAILSRLVTKFGARNWSTIARGIPGRSGKSCRLRWCNQLDPYVKRKPFTGMRHSFISLRVLLQILGRLINTGKIGSVSVVYVAFRIEILSVSCLIVSNWRNQESVSVSFSNVMRYCSAKL